MAERDIVRVKNFLSDKISVDKVNLRPARPGSDSELRYSINIGVMNVGIRKESHDAYKFKDSLTNHLAGLYADLLKDLELSPDRVQHNLHEQNSDETMKAYHDHQVKDYDSQKNKT